MRFVLTCLFLTIAATAHAAVSDESRCSDMAKPHAETAYQKCLEKNPSAESQCRKWVDDKRDKAQARCVQKLSAAHKEDERRAEQERKRAEIEATIARTRAENDARMAKQRAEAAREEAVEAAAEEKKKQLCGADYHKIRVGMTLDRANQCFGRFRMVGQIHRKDGVLVSTYEYAGGHIYVIDGKISAWRAPR